MIHEMRLLSLLLLALAGSVSASEHAYPLWDGHETVAEYARKVNLPPTQTLDLGNGINLETVLIPAGKFIMGTPEPKAPGETIAIGQTILCASAGFALVLILAVLIPAIRKKRRPKFSLRWLMLFMIALSLALYGGVRMHKTELAWQEYELARRRYAIVEPNEKPAHIVTLTQPFYMGKYLVIQEQYQQLMGTNPSHFKGKDNPIEKVSWDNAVDFCKKLSEQTKQEVRLPTEAEWEYSCRAGTRTTYYSGDSEADLARVAWYFENSNYTPHPVGQKEPNVFGLYDMHGNVWQWCQDWYSEDYYGKSEAENPKGPANGAVRSLRGGTWSLLPMYCRSVSRVQFDPDTHIVHIGFRVVVPAFKTP